ncbi:MAG: hypothetical protein KKD39_04340, partial [Candidatus Altiarchaeota archaeon]|nr:hypothetical protein [Candidatus Altiarchaeota archaeon]
SIVSKAMPRDVTTLVSNQITKTLDRFKTYGGRHDGRILKAVDDSLEGVEPAAFPQFFDNAITYAIKYGVDNGDFSSPGGINRALNLARNLTRAGIECEYMSRLLGFCMAKGFNAHKVVEYYCSGFDQEAERIRTSPVKIHVRENASAIAAKGLMASAGLKDVTLTYGVELQPYSVLANMWDTFDKELLEAQLQDHELQRKAKERLGSQRYEMLRSNINAKLSSVDSVYGPVKRVERHQHQSPEMVFEFFDRSQSGPTGLSYQPFKYHLPQPVKAEYAEAFSRSLGFQPGEKVVVLGSPEPSESERFIEAYSQIPPDKKPKLIIAPRNTDQYGAIVKQLETHSIQHRFRSDQENNGADVVVMDTMGELLMAYAIADKAFIGENRNILEPASQGKMPHYFAGSWEKNQMALDLLKRERACCEVSTPEEIMAAIVLEPEPSAGKRALSVVAEMRDEIIPRYGRLALRMAHLWEMQCNPSKANALFDS